MRRRLIVNADDFGPNPNVVDSVVQGAKTGCITSTSVMVTLGDISASIAKLKTTPQIGIGAHLNITSGKSILPADEVPTLVTKDGSFFSRTDLRTMGTSISEKELRLELLAQIERLERYEVHVSHLDNHHPEIYLFPRLFQVIVDIAHDLKLPIRMPFTESLVPFRSQFAKSLGIKTEEIEVLGQTIAQQCERAGVRYPDAFFPHLERDGSPTESLVRLIQHLPDGISELCLHVGTAAPAQQRELAAITHPDSLAILAQHSIDLVTFAELKG